MKLVIILLAGILSFNHSAKAQVALPPENKPISQPSIIEFEMRQTSAHSKDPSFLMSWGSDVIGKNIAHLRFRRSELNKMTYTLTYHRGDSAHRVTTRKGVELSLLEYQQIKETLTQASPNCNIDIKFQSSTMKILSVTSAKACAVEQARLIDTDSPNLQNCDHYLIHKSENPSIYTSPTSPEKNAFVWPFQKPQVKIAGSVATPTLTVAVAVEKPEEVVRDEAIHGARNRNLCY